ncbi:MAG: plastocyanin/azurin family copper-binding protein [Solirubrobacteraceae bacterium]|nr:plastocyanin/azurin family copper-binding protein [Solirubrobacteraceae bacterium]MDP4673551.1 plastocyanin/azurin family copper-binding protein [Solirubrobacteraceae bacterium]MDP4920981.1 plastocyanin/azurin family copper-binding protein [Solirubrobacteraceae bacterium]
MRRNQLQIIGSATAVLIAATALAACGSSSSTDTTAAPAATTTAAATTEASSASTNVDVVLNEMNVMAMPGEANAGDVTFDVKNEGAAGHNLVVIKTDTTAADLGEDAAASEAGKVGKVDEVAAGQSKDLTLKLDAGQYALICNLPGHYGAGMYQDFTVN